MPLTKKGNKILKSMQEEYGAKKGQSVFYASINAGRIHGADPRLDRRKAVSGAKHGRHKAHV